MDLRIGLDLGSTAIKVVLVDNGRIVWKQHTPTAPGQENIARRLIDDVLANLELKPDDIREVISTGYGKRLFLAANRNIDEITANANGLFRLSEQKCEPLSILAVRI